MFSVLFAVFCAAAPVLLMGDPTRIVAVLVAMAVAGMWQALWQQLHRREIAAWVDGWRTWRGGRALPQLPFTQAGSPSAYISRTGGFALARLRCDVWPANWRALATAGGTLVALWVGSLLLGAVALVLCALACFAVQLGLFADVVSARAQHSRVFCVGLVNAALVSLGVLLGRTTIATVSTQWLMISCAAGCAWLLFQWCLPRPLGGLLWASVLAGVVFWYG